MSVVGPWGEGLGEDAHHATAPGGAMRGSEDTAGAGAYVFGLAGGRRRDLDASARRRPVLYGTARRVEERLRVRWPFTVRRSSSSSQVTMLWKKTRSPSSSPRVTSVMCTFVAPNSLSAHCTAFSGLAASPQVKMSSATQPTSGQVCKDMCD